LKSVRDIRNQLASAVATAVLLPLMIVMYLMTRWASGQLDSAGTIGLLVVLALVLIGGGLNILRKVDVEIEEAVNPAPVSRPDTDETEPDTTVVDE